MGSLSNLYISQSYQSLIHIGTNNTASATLIGLQDGLGNNIGVSVNTAGDLFLSGSLTASLQQGYLYVGNASGKTTAFATSSLVTTVNTGSLVTTASFNAFTQSVNSATQSLFTSASLALVTASFDNNTRNLTFTKGNTTQFSVNIPDVSGSTINTASFATTASFNAYTQSTNIRLNNLESTSASVNVSITNLNSTTSSFATSIANLNTTTASLNSSVSQLNASSASQQVSIDSLNTFTASQSTASIVTSINNLNTFSASALVSISNINSTTASLNTSVSNLNTFTSSQLTINSGYNTFTSSANQRLGSLETNSASVNTSISALNTFTASQSTASLVTSITELNTFSASAKISINALNTNSASVNTSISNLNTFTQSQQAVNILLSDEIDSLQAKTGSYATTGSNNFIGNQTITGNISAFSASFTYLQTIFESSSIIYSSGSNQFGDELTDVQTLSGSVKVQGSLTVNGTPVLTSSVDISGLVTTASFNSYTQSNNQRVSSLEVNSASVNVSITNINSTTASLNTSVTALNTFTASQSTASLVTSIDNLNTFSASALVSISNINSTTASLLVETQNLELFSASALISISNLNQSSASQQVSIDNLNQKTGSYATTGSNTFRGNETFEDAGGNASTLVPTSGSLMLVAKSFTSASAHLSSSFTNSVNLIFKNNDNTADTIISGSNNIFTNPTAITTGFKRYIGGNSNIAMNASAVPQISGSMGFSPTMSNNYFGGTAGMIMRGPVSSSAYTISGNLFNNTTAFSIGSAAATNAEKMVSGFTMSNNVGNVFVRLQAYKTPLSASVTYSTSTGAGVVDLNLHSSSINYGGNISYGGTTINNLYFPTTVDITSSLVTVNSCQFMGTNNIVFSGSNASMTGETRRLGNSLMIGFNSASLVLNGDSGSLFATSILGAGLSVTGSNSRFTTVNVPNNDFGSAFVGRYNDQSGNKARTAETIFAVGTGTANATANRKTGFLIDSGSNSFFEGTLNVSGATSLNGTTNITGSLLVNGVAVVGVNTGSFATTGSNSFNGNQTITGSLILSSSATVELQVIGNTLITGSLIVSSSTGQFNRINALDTTIQRIETSLSFTGSRFGGGILSTSVELENLSATEFGFNQLSSADALTGTQFILNTNKDSTFTELKLNARYTGSNDATIKIRNTAGVRTFTSDADTSTFNGNVKVASTFQLQLPVGSNQQAGTAVLDGGNPGTVTVSNSLVTASSVIMLTKQTLTNAHMVAVSSKGAGTFTITSNGNGDADTVGWFIINNS